MPAAAMPVVVPGLGTTAVYSVQEGNARTITVEVQRLEDAEGLEAELWKSGVTADITYLPTGKSAPEAVHARGSVPESPMSTMPS